MTCRWIIVFNLRNIISGQEIKLEEVKKFSKEIVSN